LQLSSSSQPHQEAVDLLLAGGLVITLNDTGEIFAPGAVAVRGDSIVAVGPRAEILSRYQALRLLDCPDDLILPGLVNAHTHAAMTCFRGLADDLPLAQWLQDHIFPAERLIDRDLVYWGTKLAVAEMLLSGTTTFCDMYLFADAVAQAARECGIRAVVGEVLYDFPSTNYGTVDNGLKFSEELVQTWQGDPLVRVAIQPHAIYTCSPDLLVKCGQLADRYGIPLIIHLAETHQEVQDCEARYQATPVGHLEHLGLLAPNLVADHAVVLTDADMDLLARRQVAVVHCPESNMKLASGVAPVVELLARGVTVALGTDGCASNNNLDMFQEMDTTAKLHKVHRLDPTVMPAATVVSLATSGGARALHLAESIGTLAAGKQADIIVVDGTQPHMVPLYHPYSHLTYVAGGADVRTAVVNGRIVMRDRQVLSFDISEAMAKVREIARRIRSAER